MGLNLFEVEKNLSQDIVKLCKSYSVCNRGMMREKMYTFLASAIISAPIKENDFLLEIGTFHGLTATFIARLLQLNSMTNSILSIDPFGRLEKASVVGNYYKYIENTSLYEVSNQCISLTAFSYQAAPLITNNIPFIMIDGSHKYNDVRSDLELYLPKLKTNGIAYLHDNCEIRYPGVFRAINECIRSNEQYEILVDDYYVIIRKMSVL